MIPEHQAHLNAVQDFKAKANAAGLTNLAAFASSHHDDGLVAASAHDGGNPKDKMLATADLLESNAKLLRAAAATSVLPDNVYQAGLVLMGSLADGIKAAL